MHEVLLAISLCLLTLCSGFFSGSETALFSLSSMRVRSYQKHPDKRKQLIAFLVLRPKDLLVTILILNVAINILAQNVASNLFTAYSGWSLKVGVPLLLTLLFGEVIPKSVALQNNTLVAHTVAPTINRARRILGPLRTTITQVTTTISKYMFFFLRREPEISRDELEHVLESSKSQGLLHHDEAEMIDGFLDLRDAQVKELMRPREDILYYDIQEPVAQLTHLFVDQECSRVPVCDGEINNILGMISARQYFLQREAIRQPKDIQKHLSKPFFVPETTLARGLIRQLDQKGKVLAMVVDEYGSVSGLITREDLVEVVVGEIEDRRDAKSDYTEAGDGVIIASGKLELSDFEEIFHIELHSPSNMVTIAGWLTEQLGDIPKAGTNFVTKDFLFHVLAADPHRIRRLYIRHLSRSQGGQSE